MDNSCILLYYVLIVSVLSSQLYPLFPNAVLEPLDSFGVASEIRSKCGVWSWIPTGSWKDTRFEWWGRDGAAVAIAVRVVA